MKNEKRKFIELFAGIGGFRLGLEKAGWECVWANEIDPHACKTYRSYHNRQPLCWEESKGIDGMPNNKVGKAGSKGIRCVQQPMEGGTGNNKDIEDKRRVCNIGEHNSDIYEGDIRKVDPNTIPDFDMLTGGFPCQPFSVAGKRKGFEDTRGTLFHEILRILKAKRPKLLLLENVKGLLSHDQGRTFATILIHLDELGYDIEWGVLNTKAYLPQNRERVFIVGHLRE